MQEYKIILTWEAIYDVTDIADYIEEEFGQQRADRFQSDLKEQMQNLSQFSTAFPRTQILYRGYSIHKRSFPPSIIFYIIMGFEQGGSEAEENSPVDCFGRRWQRA